MPTDPRAQAVLIQHRDQLDQARRRLDSILAQPDLGAGDRGSPAQAADRLTASMERIHRMDRQAHGITDAATGPAVAVIVVPARAGSVEDWAAGLGIKAPDAKRTRKRTPARMVEDVELADLDPMPGEGQPADGSPGTPTAPVYKGTTGGPDDSQADDEPAHPTAVCIDDTPDDSEAGQP